MAVAGRLKRALLVIVVAMVALVVLAAVVGSLQPVNHTASHTATLSAPPERVWAEITDFERQPEWVPEVTKVERLADRDGMPSYQESFGQFSATTVVTTFEPPRLLVKEILPGGPFYGSWTWELTPAGEGTRLTITERGTVKNALFRAMMIFADPSKSARQYTEALAQRLGVATPPGG